MLLCVFVGMAYWHNEYLPQIRSTFRFRWSVLRRTGKKFTDTFLSGEALQNSERAQPVTETALQPSGQEEIWDVEVRENGKVLEEAIELDATSIFPDRAKESVEIEEKDPVSPGIQLEMNEE